MNLSVTMIVQKVIFQCLQEHDMDLVGLYKNIMAWLKKGDEKTGMALTSAK